MCAVLFHERPAHGKNTHGVPDRSRPLLSPCTLCGDRWEETCSKYRRTTRLSMGSADRRDRPIAQRFFGDFANIYRVFRLTPGNTTVRFWIDCLSRQVQTCRLKKTADREHGICRRLCTFCIPRAKAALLCRSAGFSWPIGSRLLLSKLNQFPEVQEIRRRALTALPRRCKVFPVWNKNVPIAAISSILFPANYVNSNAP